ncbi:MAG TPA: hypothetical protein VGZ06_05050 [Candidatus Cybelea sp.]|jgi:hypothetical protein|nr:hypothetical protein [Candidatus Cybelea sp.]
MPLSQRILIAAVAAAAMVVSGAPAMAHGYNGNSISMFVPASHGYSGAWPVTVTGSQFSNGTGCLTLTGNARSGSASLVMEGEKYSYGSFVVLNDILVANIIKPSGSQNGALMFMASAGRGHIGQGVFENIEGGSNFDFGALAFDMKNGC